LGYLQQNKLFDIDDIVWNISFNENVTETVRDNYNKNKTAIETINKKLIMAHNPIIYGPSYNVKFF
jgi:hypothetical protein